MKSIESWILLQCMTYYPGQKKKKRHTQEIHAVQVHCSIMGYRAISTSMRGELATHGYSAAGHVDVQPKSISHDIPMIKQRTSTS